MKKNKTWLVYGIMRPDTYEIIYVGITQNIKTRLRCHRSDAASAVWEMASFFYKQGTPVEYCIFDEFISRKAAQIYEDLMISVLRRSYNRTYTPKFHNLFLDLSKKEMSAYNDFVGEFRIGFDPSLN